MNKIILALIFGSTSLYSLGQTVQTEIYDFLDEENPSYNIPPTEAGAHFLRMNTNSTSVNYTVEFELNKTNRLEQLRFAYNAYGAWRLPAGSMLTIEVTDLRNDSVCFINYETASDSWIRGNYIYYKNYAFADLVLAPGKYQMDITLMPTLLFQENNLNFKNNGDLRPNRYLAGLIDRDGNFPIKILGTPLCPELNTQLCANSQNFALGYDESAAITINYVENAVGALSYAWSNEETSAGIVVAPTVTTTYNVTVTDENGCTGNAAHEVIVYDVAYTKPEKDGKEKDEKDLAKEAEKAAKELAKGHNEVIMTHKGDHEHKVKAKDVAKKLNDKKGEWTLGTLAMLDVDFSGGQCADEDRYKTEWEETNRSILEVFNFYAYPNPVKNEITITSDTKLNGKIQLYDLYGNQIIQQNLENTWEVQIDLSFIREGFYVLIFEDLDGKSTTKRILKN